MIQTFKDSNYKIPVMSFQVSLVKSTEVYTRLSLIEIQTKLPQIHSHWDQSCVKFRNIQLTISSESMQLFVYDHFCLFNHQQNSYLNQNCIEKEIECYFWNCKELKSVVFLILLYLSLSLDLCIGWLNCQQKNSHEIETVSSFKLCSRCMAAGWM